MTTPKPPKNKAELLENMEIGRAAWESLLERFSEADLKKPGVEGTWSVRDVLSHIAGYEQYAWAMLLDQKTGENRQTATFDAYYQLHLTMHRAQHPDWPEQVQQIPPDKINELFTMAYRFKQPREVKEMEREAYQRLYEMVQMFTDEELNRQFTPNGKSLMDILPNQCYQHYYLHMPALERWLENQA